MGMTDGVYYIVRKPRKEGGHPLVLASFEVKNKAQEIEILEGKGSAEQDLNKIVDKFPFKEALAYIDRHYNESDVYITQEPPMQYHDDWDEKEHDKRTSTKDPEFIKSQQDYAKKHKSAREFQKKYGIDVKFLIPLLKKD